MVQQGQRGKLWRIGKTVVRFGKRQQVHTAVALQAERKTASSAKRVTRGAKKHLQEIFHISVSITFAQVSPRQGKCILGNQAHNNASKSATRGAKYCSKVFR